MAEVLAITGLPEGSIVRGQLYDYPGVSYELGDVLEVELPSGIMIDVGWEGDGEEKPFRIVAYRGYYGNKLAEVFAGEPGGAAIKVGLLASLYADAPVISDQLERLTQKIDVWIAAHSDKICSVTHKLVDTERFLTVVTRGDRFDGDIESDLAAFDVGIAQSPQFDGIRFFSRILPRTLESAATRPFFEE